MATPDFMIVDLQGNMIAGPLKKGKAKRTLEALPNGRTCSLVHYRPSAAFKKPAAPAQPAPEPAPKKVEEPVDDGKNLQATIDEQIQDLMEPDKWQFRSSTYSREEAVQELISRLSLKDFEIVKVTKGWYINYNDTE